MALLHQDQAEVLVGSQKAREFSNGGSVALGGSSEFTVLETQGGQGEVEGGAGVFLDFFFQGGDGDEVIVLGLAHYLAEKGLFLAIHPRLDRCPEPIVTHEASKKARTAPELSPQGMA